jgi:PIN domain nuclease of toxin-antitoxin system
MKYLFDTHTFLWAMVSPQKLSTEVKDVILDRNNLIYLSSASVWEIVIKSSLGKIKKIDKTTSTASIENFIIKSVDVNDFMTLGIAVPHVLEIAKLEDFHKDPFDRILVAQARVENITILTKDKFIMKYKVKTLW